MVMKFSGLFKHGFVIVKTWAAALHQWVQGGCPSNTLVTWMGIEPMLPDAM
jgi:hypothetical protein